MLNLGNNKMNRLLKLLASFNSQLKLYWLLCYKWIM